MTEEEHCREVRIALKMVLDYYEAEHVACVQPHCVACHARSLLAETPSP